ncbi:tripartite motif-containing protein 2-like isoform X2 [Pomacea canaliculata]|nr:tripartite motif-containing protein 2-like isoform X2 [Pomacea canaliculata]XP_025080721.1 tripartite motif-containing protein 2-like isoform X2 [Pomacea canaliculata]XP_025080722.1 tripartite motif-containing protein 2-like isoform X2 [Pomacea canaliculata]XP_025080723.1 tripartite motif-containing protein 2-like isoform X2 [Pomacea canaliculata]
MAATQDNMTCAVCTEVYTSPRFLPCHHTFCLECLEELAKRHGDTIPCPTCRAPVTVPPGGVCDLQVNFYFTEEALERARSEGSRSMCPVHNKECAIFFCTQCDQAICIRCKLTKHEGHVTEDLSDAVARCKQTIEHELDRLDAALAYNTFTKFNLKLSDEHLQEKKVALAKQIQVRHDAIVAMAGRYRDQAMRNLQKMSESLRNEFTAITQPIIDEENSIFELQERAVHALSSACDMEILEVEREMTRRGRAERLTELRAGLPTLYYLPGLDGDFTNDIENCVKMYIGSPVKLTKQIGDSHSFTINSRCGDGECCEVHALRQKEDKRIEVFYGGTGGDFSKERSGILMNYDSKRTIADQEYGKRVSPITRRDHILEWEGQEKRILASKDAGMYCINQNCTTGECFISLIKLQQTGEKETWCFGLPLIHPEVNRIQNFDADKDGMLFAVVDEDKDETSNDESCRRDGNSTRKERSRRVVRVYSNQSNKPVATYTPPVQPFFPTDVCFWGKKLLVISDWMNDCVHVTQVDDDEITFDSYLPVDMVRPTALNVGFQGELLIGCGDGLILQCLFSASLYEK